MLNSLETFMAGIWPTLWHVGIGSSFVMGCITAAVFLPVFRRELLWLALAATIALAFEAIGAHDEAIRCAAREKLLSQKVHNAVTKAAHDRGKDPYDTAE